MDDKKPNFALLIAGKGKPKDEGMSPSKDEHAEDLGMDGPEAEDSACKDILMAIKTGDHMLLKDALKDLIALQEGAEPEEEAPSKEDGESDGY